jgi:acyl-CoA synthetase (NDP forming)
MSEDVRRKLDPIFKPKSIAVIGASNNPWKWGYRMITNPLRSGYKGHIYPVNRKEKTVAGIEAYPSILKVPEDIDLAVIVVPAPTVPEVMEECVEKGVKGAIIISAGFAEIGDEGRKLQEKVVRIAEKGGIPFVGPNCNGIWSADVRLNLALHGATLLAGPIGFISQSGTFGGYLATMAMSHGFGINKFVHMGNEASLVETDYLQYFAEDPNIKVIVGYIESFRNGRKFFELAREIVKKKPIVLYKAGQTEVGARAALSHTASITGSDEVFEAICKQAGIIRAYETFHLFIMAESLAKQPLPKGNGVAIIGGGGGYCVSTAEACVKLGLSLPEFDDETKKKLKKILLPHAPTPRNPVDTAADWRPEVYGEIIEIVAQLEYIHGIIISPPIIPHSLSDFGSSVDLSYAVSSLKGAIYAAEKIASVPIKYGKPVIATVRRLEESPFLNLLKSAGIPLYETPEDSARAMSVLVRYANILKRSSIL